MANVLIVDDSPIIRRNLREIFENTGHHVVAEAADGYEALEAFDRYRIDLTTMDIQLPGIDGIETVRRIRDKKPDADIIMISTLEYKSKVFEAIRAGAKHYILKPFTDDKVVKVVNAVLGILPSAEPAGNAAQADAAAPAQTAAQPDGSAPWQQNTPAPKKREPLELKPPALTALPFELVIKDGRIVLIVQKIINEMNVRYLYNSLVGLLYFRRAKYVLEFWEPITHDEGFRLVVEFAAHVRARNGTVVFVTDDTVLTSKLKAKVGDCVYRSYTDIKW
jgi:DNA-binding NarL/FixJ family response regulator